MPALKGEEVAPEHGNHTPKWKKAAPIEVEIRSKKSPLSKICIEIRFFLLMRLFNSIKPLQ
ncbi:hypothetical protein BFZC1_10982 [Lysinibacillus fusiformis ZC1]|nr:hypothetical protein BFZC1_10982 [Lysinibacillus fusiformis ZC1]